MYFFEGGPKRQKCGTSKNVCGSVFSPAKRIHYQECLSVAQAKTFLEVYSPLQGEYTTRSASG